MYSPVKIWFTYNQITLNIPTAKVILILGVVGEILFTKIKISAQKINNNITSGGTIVKNKSKKLISFLIDSIKVLIPNNFTPNEDFRNDYFTVTSQCEYSNFVLTINDRWGYTVFTSNNVNAKWDGRFKGNLCPEDIYSYQLETTEKLSGKKQVRSGHVSLFR